MWALKPVGMLATSVKGLAAEDKGSEAPDPTRIPAAKLRHYSQGALYTACV